MLIKHPNVWLAITENATLIAWTDLDLSADYPEDDDRAYMIHRAAQAELRRGLYDRVFVLDRQPRRWGEAKSETTGFSAR